MIRKAHASRSDGSTRSGGYRPPDGGEMRRWAYTNGENHRPAFEDAVLARIDNERAWKKLRREAA